MRLQARTGVDYLSNGRHRTYPRGLDVEVLDEDAIAAMGLGGLLGVNQGSTEPPRLVKLTYTPRRPSAT